MPGPGIQADGFCRLKKTYVKIFDKYDSKTRKMNIKKACQSLILVAAVVLLAGCGETPASTTAPLTSTSASPPVAVVETSLGTFKIQPFQADAPKTVANFISLSNKGFYNQSSTNKVIFHRIIKDFMVQTGDPTGTGSGGPGYTFPDELPVKRSYDVGIVAMANAGPNTNGSQFFICTGAQAKNLNKTPNYTQFGMVTDGMDVVLKIAAVPVTVSPYGELSKPVDPPYIIKITIQ
jgi:peptidylprolyl isomerase/peptidyl-prolyl cis-trans isomerase B (cyclophilin B)